MFFADQKMGAGPQTIRLLTNTFKFLELFARIEQSRGIRSGRANKSGPVVGSVGLTLYVILSGTGDSQAISGNSATSLFHALGLEYL